MLYNVLSSCRLSRLFVLACLAMVTIAINLNTVDALFSSNIFFLLSSLPAFSCHGWLAPTYVLYIGCCHWTVKEIIHVKAVMDAENGIFSL